MAYKCDNCGKTVNHGNLVSHAKNRTRTLRKPNLHRARVIVDGKVVRQMLCTKCLRRAKRPHKQQETGSKKQEISVATA